MGVRLEAMFKPEGRYVVPKLCAGLYLRKRLRLRQFFGGRACAGKFVARNLHCTVHTYDA